MKRVVAGVTAEGKSFIVSADGLPVEPCFELWDSDPESDVGERLAAFAPETAYGRGQVPGCALAVRATPDRIRTSPSRGHTRDRGGRFDTTRTADFDFIVDDVPTLAPDWNSVTVGKQQLPYPAAGKVRQAQRERQGAAVLAPPHATGRRLEASGTAPFATVPDVSARERAHGIHYRP